MTNELLKLKALVECLKRDSKCECCINDECEHCDLLKEKGTQKERIEALYKVIKELDIELLTDTEQRIFLSAMRREREICQEVDDEYPDNDSKVSLVRVCNSIERKVKKIWE